VRVARELRPGAWVTALAVLLVVAGGVFAYLLYNLARLARASRGAELEIHVTGADVIVLGGGALACWAVAGALAVWRKRRAGP